MRALVIHAANDIRIEDHSPGEPGPGEVLVRVRAGGICGSDLHYFHDGGFGTVRLREPMILGHEAAGIVEALGPGVSGIAPGTRVAISPSRPCNQCRYCREGRHNHCLDMRFFGSAMRFPHVQGAFRDRLVCDAAQVHPIADHVGYGEAAMAEPLSVVLHAARQAGELLGRRVLVTGCGPIGSLAVLVARHAGATEIVATDISRAPLEAARRVGADRAIDVAAEPGALSAYGADKGHFDILFEASGNQAALRGALEALRPGARIVQCGLGGDATLPINTIVAKELELVGTFRFHAEFALAVELLNRRRLDVSSLISATYPLDDAREAFAAAGDRSRAVKVQIAFD